MGTGFAQPNPIRKNNTRPNTSKCAIGLSVSLPASFGVRSPHLTATRACEYS